MAACPTCGVHGQYNGTNGYVVWRRCLSPSCRTEWSENYAPMDAHSTAATLLPRININHGKHIEP